MAEENNLDVDQLYQKHKKERKDLQAQIQSLKKTIGKGNKRQKKEVSEEITRLEFDLQKKHDEEIANFKFTQIRLEDPISETERETNQSENNHVSTVESNQYAQKISKAQRRRERKANEERERNQRICKEEAENVFNKRNMEISAIEAILVKRDLMIHEIPSDGHCLYNAVAHQLKVLGISSYGFQDLRVKTAVHLKENMDDYLPFIVSSTSEETITVKEYEKYCDDVAKTSAWGGAIELQVLSKVLECPIEVIQATGAPYIVGDEYEAIKKLIVSYHRHMYELGAHYNSVIKYVGKS